MKYNQETIHSTLPGRCLTVCGCVRVVRGDRRGNEEPQSILMTRNCLRCGGAAKCVKTMSCVNPQSANNYMHSHLCGDAFEQKLPWQ